MPKGPLSEEERAAESFKRERAWDKQAAKYDRQIGFFERRVFGTEHRPWVCSRAEGDVLEVAIGTGLNIPHYPRDVRLTGIELSEQMLAIARRRAAEAKRDVDLRAGNAHDLPFPDESFDTVVCTFSLCNIPDEGRAVAEMKRVLRPGGKLLLADHIRSASKPLFWLQKAVEVLTVWADGDRMTRRPLEHVRAQGFEILERDRMKAGIVERIAARRP